MSFEFDRKSRGRIKANKKHKKYQKTHKRDRTPPKDRINHPNAPYGMGARMNVLPRQLDWMQAKDQIRHHATDLSVVEDLPRKTAAPRYRDHYKPRIGTNPQKHHFVTDIQKKDRSRIVHLPKVYKRLWLSNRYFKETYQLGQQDSEYHFDTIIEITDYSTKSTTRKMPGVNCKTFYITDSFRFKGGGWTSLQYHVREFRNLLCKEIKGNKKILVHCAAGTNRSPFLVASFASLQKNWTPEQAMDYVRNTKLEQGYDRWDTMTNMYFWRFLKHHEMFKK